MTKDAKAAALAALNDILDARHQTVAGSEGVPPMMPGMPSMTMKVDPRLNKPQPDLKGSSDMEINDPNDVLSKQQQTKVQMPENQAQNSSGESKGQSQGQQQSGQSGDSGQNSGDSQSGESGSDGQSGSQSKDGQESGKTGDSKDKGKNGSGAENNKQDQQNGTGKADKNNTSDDYTRAWNEIMSRFDDDNISDGEIQALIDRINAGEISI